MAQSSSTLSTLEKIKALAMAVIGAGIFSTGSTYFSQQSSYRVPRILLPVFGFFGHVGLAIGMMALGAALMCFAHRKYTRHNGRALHLVVVMLVGMLGFYGILFSTSTRRTTIDDVKASLGREQTATQARIAKADRPTLGNDRANGYLDRLEALQRDFKHAVDARDSKLLDQCEQTYVSLVSKEFGDIAKEISTSPEYRDFALYNAKLLGQIQMHRTH